MLKNERGRIEETKNWKGLKQRFNKEANFDRNSNQFQTFYSQNLVEKSNQQENQNLQYFNRESLLTKLDFMQQKGNYTNATSVYRQEFNIDQGFRPNPGPKNLKQIPISLPSSFKESQNSDQENSNFENNEYTSSMRNNSEIPKFLQESLQKNPNNQVAEILQQLYEDQRSRSVKQPNNHNNPAIQSTSIYQDNQQNSVFPISRSLNEKRHLRSRSHREQKLVNNLNDDSINSKYQHLSVCAPQINMDPQMKTNKANFFPLPLKNGEFSALNNNIDKTFKNQISPKNNSPLRDVKSFIGGGDEELINQMPIIHSTPQSHNQRPHNLLNKNSNLAFGNQHAPGSIYSYYEAKQAAQEFQNLDQNLHARYSSLESAQSNGQFKRSTSQMKPRNPSNGDSPSRQINPLLRHQEASQINHSNHVANTIKSNFLPPTSPFQPIRQQRLEPIIETQSQISENTLSKINTKEDFNYKSNTEISIQGQNEIAGGQISKIDAMQPLNTSGNKNAKDVPPQVQNIKSHGGFKINDQDFQPHDVNEEDNIKIQLNLELDVNQSEPIESRLDIVNSPRKMTDTEEQQYVERDEKFQDQLNISQTDLMINETDRKLLDPLQIQNGDEQSQDTVFIFNKDSDGSVISVSLQNHEQNKRVNVDIKHMNSTLIPWSIQYVHKQQYKFQGEGGYGQVYEAFDPNLSQKIALKFIRSNHQRDIEKILKQAVLEKYLNTICKKEHDQEESEYVIEVYDPIYFYTVNKLNYLIIPMQLGICSLEEYIAHRISNKIPFSDIELLFYGVKLLKYNQNNTFFKKLLILFNIFNSLKQYLRILNYLFLNSISHRDIQPANFIFCPRKKQWQISDFGIAKLAKDIETPSCQNISGTPFYLSPLLNTQIREKKDSQFQYSLKAADIYALGVILLKMKWNSPNFSLKQIEEMQEQSKQLYEKDPQSRVNLLIYYCTRTEQKTRLEFNIDQFLNECKDEFEDLKDDCVQIQQKITQEIQEQKQKFILSRDDNMVLEKMEIATAYVNIWNTQKAISIYMELLPILKESNKDTNLVISCLNKIGETLIKIGKFEESIEFFKSAQQIYQKQTDNKESKLVATMYNNIGLALKNIGKFQQALQFFDKDLRISEKLKLSDPLETATSLNNIGVVLSKLERYPQAIQKLQRSLRLREQFLGKDHPQIATTLNNLGTSLTKTGQFQQALSYYMRALRIREINYGNSHHTLANVYNNIGNLLEHMNQYDRAVGYYKSALAINEQILGESNPINFNSLMLHGNILLSNQMSQEALNCFVDSICAAKHLFGENSEQVADILMIMGRAYQDNLKFDKANESYVRAQQIRMNLSENRTHKSPLRNQ